MSQTLTLAHETWARIFAKAKISLHMLGQQKHMPYANFAYGVEVLLSGLLFYATWKLCHSVESFDQWPCSTSGSSFPSAAIPEANSHYPCMKTPSSYSPTSFGKMFYIELDLLSLTGRKREKM